MFFSFQFYCLICVFSQTQDFMRGKGTARYYRRRRVCGKMSLRQQNCCIVYKRYLYSWKCSSSWQYIIPNKFHNHTSSNVRHAIYRAVITKHSVPEEGRRWWSKHRSKSKFASCVIMKCVWNLFIYIIYNIY